MLPSRNCLVRPCVVVAFFVLAGAGAGHAADLEACRSRALAACESIFRANPDVVAATRADLETVVAARPEDALARVYLGRVLVLQAATLSPRDALRQAREGCAMMDAAVASAPRDAAIRFVRARSDYQMPMILDRESVAVRDFATLVAAAREADGGGMDAALRRAIFFHAGSLALKRSEPSRAIDLLQAAAQVTADSPTDADVQSMLALAREELSSHDHAQSPPPGQAPPSAP